MVTLNRDLVLQGSKVPMLFVGQQKKVLMHKAEFDFALHYSCRSGMCLVIQYHHLLLHFCHSSTFVADQLYLGLCSDILIMRFESRTATSKKEVLGDAQYSLIWVLGGKGHVRHYSTSKSRRHLLGLSHPCRQSDWMMLFLDFFGREHNNRIFTWEKFEILWEHQYLPGHR